MKRKFLALIMSFVLVFSMTISLTACDNESNKADGTVQGGDTVQGGEVQKETLDLKKVFNSGLDEFMLNNSMIGFQLEYFNAQQKMIETQLNDIKNVENQLNVEIAQLEKQIEGSTVVAYATATVENSGNLEDLKNQLTDKKNQLEEVKNNKNMLLEQQTELNNQIKILQEQKKQIKSNMVIFNKEELKANEANLLNDPKDDFTWFNKFLYKAIMDTPGDVESVWTIKDGKYHFDLMFSYFYAENMAEFIDNIAQANYDCAIFVRTEHNESLENLPTLEQNKYIYRYGAFGNFYMPIITQESLELIEQYTVVGEYGMDKSKTHIVKMPRNLSGKVVIPDGVKYIDDPNAFQIEDKNGNMVGNPNITDIQFSKEFIRFLGGLNGCTGLHGTAENKKIIELPSTVANFSNSWFYQDAEIVNMIIKVNMTKEQAINQGNDKLVTSEENNFIVEFLPSVN